MVLLTIFFFWELSLSTQCVYFSYYYLEMEPEIALPSSLFHFSLWTVLVSRKITLKAQRKLNGYFSLSIFLYLRLKKKKKNKECTYHSISRFSSTFLFFNVGASITFIKMLQCFLFKTPFYNFENQCYQLRYFLMYIWSTFLVHFVP